MFVLVHVTHNNNTNTDNNRNTTTTPTTPATSKDKQGRTKTNKDEQRRTKTKPHGGSAAGHQLGTVVASWVSDLRRHAAAVGKPSAAAEEYISQLESTTANIAEIYTEWVNHCEGNEVDPVHARTDAILGCVDTFATSLARAGRSHSHFNGRMRIISNIYKLVRGVDVNTKTVKDTRKRLKQSHTAGPKRTNASFNSGKVFHALAEYQREPGFPETDQELFYRRAFTFAGRTDFCARADDFSHLKLRQWSLGSMIGLDTYVKSSLLKRIIILSIGYKGRSF